MTEKEKIKFKDLSGWLKSAVILMWIIGITYSVSFIMWIIGLAL